MLYEHHKINYKSSKHIQGHINGKRVSRRESKLGQFKIPNPVIENFSTLGGNGLIPNMPTGIKNQLAGMEFLSYANVNNIGTSNNISGPFVGNKRNSRFSKRLLEMQKALQLQDMKMRHLETGKPQQSSFIHEQENQPQTNPYSSMMEAENNSSLDMLGDNNLDRQLDINCLQMEMCCQQEGESTGMEYYSHHDIRQEIDYQEYESYLNV